MSYESTKISANSSGGEIMTSEMPSSQTSANNVYPNNNSNNRTQAMIMNPMVAVGNYYNGPPQSTPTQPIPNRPMYQSYSPGPPPHHIVSIGFQIDLFFLGEKTNERFSSIVNLFSRHHLIHMNHVQVVIIHHTRMRLVFMNISTR